MFLLHIFCHLLGLESQVPLKTYHTVKSLLVNVLYFSAGIGDHNYCRNPDDSDEPWCYVSGADGQLQREACALDACQGRYLIKLAYN